MPLQIIRADITALATDAIVNAANNSLLGGGGDDGAIHRAAGPRLLEECRTLGGCDTGDAKVTGAYDLPCRYVIHTVGPIWHGGSRGEEALLRSCYRRSLAIARDKERASVAFPLISSGAYGYPKDAALRVAVDEIAAFLDSSDMLVYLVIFDKASFDIGAKLYGDVAAYIDDNYADEHLRFENSRRLRRGLRGNEPDPSYSVGIFAPKEDAVEQAEDAVTSKEDAVEPTEDAVEPTEDAVEPTKDAFESEAKCFRSAPTPAPRQRRPVFPRSAAKQQRSLDDALRNLDESFSEMLLRKIDERGMTDAECYKKANVDRKLFSKIRSDRLYRPSKPTAIAFTIALELPLGEAKDMLMKAGFALSHSSKFDVIIEYFITNGNYNVFEINETLFAFDQPLLGA